MALAAVVAVVASAYGYHASGPRTDVPTLPPPAKPAGVAGDTAEQVQVLRMYLEKGEVTDARRTLDGLPTSVRERADVSGLGNDVARRELQRDTALRAAQDCMRTTTWDCAVHHARLALAIDRTSDEARQIVDKITQLGLAQPIAADPPGRRSLSEPASPPLASPRQAEPRPNECETTVADGRRALQAKKYDEALSAANGALAAIGLCPGARELEQDARRARDEARRGEAGPDGRYR